MTRPVSGKQEQTQEVLQGLGRVEAVSQRGSLCWGVGLRMAPLIAACGCFSRQHYLVL